MLCFSQNIRELGEKFNDNEAESEDLDADSDCGLVTVEQVNRSFLIVHI